MSAKTCVSALLVLCPACIEPAVQGYATTEATGSSGSTESSSEPTTTAVGSTAAGSTGAAAPTCSDGVHNQEESDVDCGGGCVPCEGGKVCGGDLDCQSGKCAEGSCFPLMESCLALHMARPELPDGVYPLDPNSDGANPQEFMCDMLGGGWTQVLYEEFGPQPVGPWEPMTTGSCGVFAEILGPFGMGTVVRLDVNAFGVPHTEIRADGEAIIIDSWDPVPGDTLSVRIDGQEVFSQFCDHTAPFQCNQEADVCGLSEFFDGKIALTSKPQPHAQDAIALEFASTLDEDIDEESWGLDMFAIFVK